MLGRTASAVGQRVDSIKQSKFGQAVANNRVVKFVTYGLTYDMHRVLTKDTAEYNERASRIWDNAERFDWRAEAVFKYIQVGGARPRQPCVLLDLWCGQAAIPAAVVCVLSRGCHWKREPILHTWPPLCRCSPRA